ncbi:hypothetical protein LSH36_626g02014, partial [Paralvinella palmiformis]
TITQTHTRTHIQREREREQHTALSTVSNADTHRETRHKEQQLDCFRPETLYSLCSFTGPTFDELGHHSAQLSIIRETRDVPRSAVSVSRDPERPTWLSGTLKCTQ